MLRYQAKWILVAALVVGVSAEAKATKKDMVADSIQKARAESDAAAIDDSAALKDIIGAGKLVASEETEAEASKKTAAAIMAGGADPSVGATKTEPATAVATAEAEAAEDSAVETKTEAPDKEDISKMNEKDIPVLAAKAKPAKPSVSVWARVLASGGILLLLAISVTWGLKKYTKGHQAKNAATKIKILTQHHIGPKKSIAIVQVAGESILVGITDHSISMLKTLALIDDEVPEETPRDFNVAMDSYDFDSDETEARRSRGTDDFAMRGLGDIRDSVSKRLKGLKQI